MLKQKTAFAQSSWSRNLFFFYSFTHSCDNTHWSMILGTITRHRCRCLRWCSNVLTAWCCMYFKLDVFSVILGSGFRAQVMRLECIKLPGDQLIWLFGLLERVMFIVFDGEEIDGLYVKIAVPALEDLIVGLFQLFHAIIITGSIITGSN